MVRADGEPGAGKICFNNFMPLSFYFFRYGSNVILSEAKHFDPVRDKPRRSGRGRIARTAWPSLPFGFSVSSK
jgi:hypothetical protein